MEKDCSRGKNVCVIVFKQISTSAKRVHRQNSSTPNRRRQTLVAETPAPNGPIPPKTWERMLRHRPIVWDHCGVVCILRSTWCSRRAVRRNEQY